MSEARLVAYREKAFGLLAAVFVAGLATGVLGLRAYDKHARAEPAATTAPKEQTLVALERLSTNLELTPEQSQEVQIILDEHIMLEADLLAQMRALQQQGREEIMRVLNEQQKKKFEGMLHSFAAAP